MQNEQLDDPQNPIVPTLELVRDAWRRINPEDESYRSDELSEVEAYLHSALFQISGVAHSLRTPNEQRTMNLAKLAEELDAARQVCVLASLYLLHQCRQI